MTTTICRFALPEDHKMPKLQFEIEDGFVVLRAPPGVEIIAQCRYLHCTNAVTIGARGTVLKYCVVHSDYHKQMAKANYQSHKKKIQQGICCKPGCENPCAGKQKGFGIFCKDHADVNNRSSKEAYRKRMGRNLETDKC